MKTRELWLLASLILASFIESLGDDINGFKVFCYFRSWTKNYRGSARYQISDINTDLCSHIIFSFATIRTNDFRLNFDQDHEKFNALKVSSSIKTLLSVGGENSAEGFVRATYSDESMRQFASHTVSQLREWGFDGVDLDWEFPENKEKFTKLIQLMRGEIEAEQLSPGNERLILSIAAPAGKQRIDTGYNVTEISRHIDIINLMAYDFAGSWNNIAAFNSPRTGRPADPQFHPEFNQEWAVNYWIQLGAPPEKINLGLSFYGRAYKLRYNTVHRVGAEIDGAAYTKEIRTYKQICEFIRSGGRYHYDEIQDVPFTYDASFWIGFDDTRSIASKTQWMMERGLAGVMTWAMDMDDVEGTYCSQNTYPLSKAILRALTGQVEHVIMQPPPHYSPSILPRTGTTMPNPRYKRVCYFTNWSPTRRIEPLALRDIDLDLCTHLAYAYVFVDDVNLSVLPVGPGDEGRSSSQTGLFQSFNNLKATKPDLVTMLSIGGATAGTAAFGLISATLEARMEFATNVAAYLRRWNFDGLDIVWQYPSPSEKDQFTLLAEIIQRYFAQEAIERVMPKLLLSAAVSGTKVNIDNSYDPQRLAAAMDFLSITSYNYDLNPYATSLPAPLFPGSGGRSRDDTQIGSLSAWINKGAPKDKLLLGHLAMGHSLQLSNTSVHGIGAPVTGADVPSPIFGFNNSMAYFEVCDFVNTGADSEVVLDQIGAYSYRGTTWVGYDTPCTIKYKMHYVRTQGYGGFNLWSLDLDDFSGQHCRTGNFPLLQAMSEALMSDSVEPIQLTACNEASSTVKYSSTKEPTTPGSVTWIDPTVVGDGSKCSLSSILMTLTVFVFVF